MSEKKKPVNSKRKGSSNENTIAKILSAYLDPLKFRRSQQSGAIVGGLNYNLVGSNFSKEALTLMVGDVTPTNETDAGVIFRFVIECKAYKEKEPMDALFDRSKIHGWVDEAETDGKKIGKEGMLICKWNNTPLYVCGRFELPTKRKLILPNSKGDIQVARLNELIEDLGNNKSWWYLS